MNDQEMDELLRQAHPVRAHVSPPARQELLDELRLRTASPSRSRRRPPWLLGVAAAIAVALAISLPMALFQEGGSVIPAAEIPQEPLSSKQNPYLFLDSADWPMTYLYQDDTEYGQEIFTRDDDAELTVSWEAGAQYQGMYDDRAAEADLQEKLEVFGKQATLFGWGSRRYELLIPPGEGVYVQIRGDRLGTKQDFLNLVGHLRQLDRPTWLASLPEDIVIPDQAAVANALLGVPLPSAFDTAQLAKGEATSSYQFNVRVTKAVMCDWLEDYSQARQNQDEAGMAAVDEALSTKDNWKVLQDIDQGGGWGITVHTYADQVAAREDVSGYRKPQGLECAG